MEVSVRDLADADSTTSSGNSRTTRRNIPKPVVTFAQAFQHYPDVLNAILRMRFSSPSPIQSQLWPVLLSGFDSIAIAETGTGYLMIIKNFHFWLMTNLDYYDISLPKFGRKLRGTGVGSYNPKNTIKDILENQGIKL